MNKDFRNDMARMFSLMERMEKHSTLTEAVKNQKLYLMEASNFLKPTIRFIKDEENGDSLVLHGLDPDDAVTLVEEAGVGEVTADSENPKLAMINFQNIIEPGAAPEDVIEEAKGVVTDFIIPSIQALNNQYDLSVLNDAVNNIEQFYDSTVSVQDEGMKFKAIDELKKEIVAKIEQGNFSNAAAQLQACKSVIKLEVEMYGHQLSPDNVATIYHQAKTRYGLQPGDQNWPTFVAAPSTWKLLGREVSPSAKYRYVYETNRQNRLNVAKKIEKAQQMGINISTMKEYHQLPLQLRMKLGLDTESDTNFKGCYGYDISETVDTTGFDRFFNEVGLINNLEGTLNDLAKADQAERASQSETEEEAPQTQQQVVQQKMATPEGQKEILLDALNKLNGTSVQSGNIDSDIANQIISLCGKKAKTYNAIKPEEIQFATYVSAWMVSTGIDVTTGDISNMICNEMINNIGRSKVMGNIRVYINTIYSVSNSILNGVQRIVSTIVPKVQSSQANANPQAASVGGSLEEDGSVGNNETVNNNALGIHLLTTNDIFKSVMSL